MMKSIRAFIAIEIDTLAKQKICELIEHLKKSNTDVKWAKESQIHLTLKFLGNISQDQAAQVSEALKIIATGACRSAVNLSGIGVFPGMNRPRVVWTGISKGAADIKRLAGLVEDAMEKLGFAKEKRDFKPHLTIGRIKSLKNIKALTDLISETMFSYREDIGINKLTLFQSTLTSKGAAYTPLSETPLSPL